MPVRTLADTSLQQTSIERVEPTAQLSESLSAQACAQVGYCHAVYVFSVTTVHESRLVEVGLIEAIYVYDRLNLTCIVSFHATLRHTFVFCVFRLSRYMRCDCVYFICYDRDRHSRSDHDSSVHSCAAGTGTVGAYSKTKRLHMVPTVDASRTSHNQTPGGWTRWLISLTPSLPVVVVVVVGCWREAAAAQRALASRLPPRQAPPPGPPESRRRRQRLSRSLRLRTPLKLLKTLTSRAAVALQWHGVAVARQKWKMRCRICPFAGSAAGADEAEGGTGSAAMAAARTGFIAPSSAVADAESETSIQASVAGVAVPLGAACGASRVCLSSRVAAAVPCASSKVATSSIVSLGSSDADSCSPSVSGANFCAGADTSGAGPRTTAAPRRRRPRSPNSTSSAPWLATDGEGGEGGRSRRSPLASGCCRAASGTAAAVAACIAGACTSGTRAHRTRLQSRHQPADETETAALLLLEAVELLPLVDEVAWSCGAWWRWGRSLAVAEK